METERAPKSEGLDITAITLVGVALLILAGGVIFVSTKNSSQAENIQLQNQTPTATVAPSMEGQLQITDLKVGIGEEATNNKTVTVHYTGTLTDGTKFDSSVDRGQPFPFVLGAGKVIAGWEQGVLGMKVGGKRKLVIPPDLGYGPQGNGPIPPNSTLIFEVELLKVE